MSILPAKQLRRVTRFCPILLFTGILISCEEVKEENVVVVYTALDRVFSKPILDEFEQDSGVQVQAVYDVEASKTVGLVNRLVAEADNPKCDVFWNNEFSRTLVLKAEGVLAPYRSPSAADIPERMKDAAGYWTGFAARARVIIFNTDIVPRDDVPQSLMALTEPKWRGRVAIANPLFGTTSTHVAALFAAWGPEKAQRYLLDLKDNEAAVVAGNAVVRDRVGEGEFALGLTDTDDAFGGMDQGMSVDIVYPVDGLIIPNTLALIRGAPHPEAGKRLIDYLLSAEVERRLALGPSRQIPVRSQVERSPQVQSLEAIPGLLVDYSTIAEMITESSRFVQEEFLN